MLAVHFEDFVEFFFGYGHSGYEVYSLKEGLGGSFSTILLRLFYKTLVESLIFNK
jgi:hypothetical protein